MLRVARLRESTGHDTLTALSSDPFGAAAPAACEARPLRRRRALKETERTERFVFIVQLQRTLVLSASGCSLRHRAAFPYMKQSNYGHAHPRSALSRR